MGTKTDDSSLCESEVYAPEYRDRLRTWLEKMINSGNIPGLCWENKEQTIFRMPWKHAGRQDYNLEEDSKIFMAWAVHSGRYREGVDKPEPIVWKTRLRCALNKMPDIRELPERSRLDISEPYRVYQLLPPVHKASQIRRRLYKRSQSHENDQVKRYGEHSRASSLIDLPEKNDNEWAKQLNLLRRSSSNETSRINLSKTRTSPMTSAASALPLPGFWLPHSVNMPLKYPMSSGLTGSIQVPQPLALDPTNPRYPLVPSLPNPFLNFPTTVIPPFLPNSTNLDALKRISLMDSTLLSKSTYQEHLINLTKQLKGQNHHVSSEDNGASLKEFPVRNASPPKPKRASDENSVHFLNSKNNDLSSQNNSAMNKHSVRKFSDDLTSFQVQLNDYQHKIELLERDLEESRNAHAEEKKAREELENEREQMQMTLDQMGNSLRTLAVHIQPRSEMAWKELRKDFVQRRKEEMPTSELNMSQFLTNYERMQNMTVPDESLSQTSIPSPPPQHNAFVVLKNSNKKSMAHCHPEEVFRPKRPASPLDLSVQSPEKKRKTSCPDENVCSVYPSPPYHNSAFTTPSRSRVLSNDEKYIVTSPSSASSESPDNVVMRSRKEKADFRNNSLSPLQRNASLLQNYPQRQGTIQVT